MILSKDIIDVDNLLIGKCLRFSNDFSFYPIKYFKKQLVFQTPKLYVPYGIQEKDGKNNIELSFINKNNDNNINNFINNIFKIQILIKQKFKSKHIIDIIRDDKIRLKIMKCIYYDDDKNIIRDIPSNVYGNFIINIAGLWEYDDNFYIQSNLLQAKISLPLFLNEYSFIDENEPIVKKKPIPPPPPLPVFIVKKKSIKDIIKTNHKKIMKNDIEYNPPSIDDIRDAIKRMKKVD